MGRLVAVIGRYGPCQEGNQDGSNQGGEGCSGSVRMSLRRPEGRGGEMDRVPVGNQSVEELAWKDMLADVEKKGGCSELPTGKRDLDVTETPVSIHPAPGKYPRIRKETKNPKKSLNRTSRAT